MSAPNNGKHIAVVGGGFAGVAAAYVLRNRLSPNDRITLFDPKGFFVFAPSMIWAALGRRLDRSAFALEPALAAKEIAYVRAPVTAVRAADHAVVTENGEQHYDKLLVATGGQPDAHAVPGLAGEFRAAHWIIGEDSALEIRNQLQAFYHEPGPIVVGAAPGAGYLSAVYEIALVLDSELRKRNLRDVVPITFVTAEPYLGHLGFGQTAAREKLERLFTERNIGYRTGAGITNVCSQGVTLDTEESIPGKLSIVMPPFTGSVNVWKSEDLTDDHGFIHVNGRYQHTSLPDVYAAGVGCVFDQPILPLDSMSAPQTAYLSTHMGKASAENLAASLGYGPGSARTFPHKLDTRVIDGDDVGLYLSSTGGETLRHRAVQLPGPAAHVVKASIERLLLWRLRTGRI